jgi:DNA recombination protein RmuC
MEILFLIIGLLVGAAASFIAFKYKFQSGSSKLEERNSISESNLEQAKSELSLEREKVLDLNSKLAASGADNANLERKLAEQKKELDDLQTKFTKEFENLANRIFDEKSQRFTEQNKTNLDEILKPLGERIKEFASRVNEIHSTDAKDRATLLEQIKHLHEQSQKMSDDANNLTKALKGESKTQGMWGEFILESILERSGLVRDREYFVQETMHNEDGSLLRPDVVIKLPEDRFIIIDSKVSLTAYAEFCSVEDEQERSVLLNNHISSIKNHVKNLSQKNYQDLHAERSPDFVFMFIPIEPAFALAVQNDTNLYTDAFDKKVGIVSPYSLLPYLNMINNLWRQERQNANALEIAKQSGALYDKFVGFIDDLINIGKKIDSTKESYVDAMNKLVEGRGNLIRRVEYIKELGANATKSLPNSLLDRADDEIKLFEE